MWHLVHGKFIKNYYVLIRLFVSQKILAHTPKSIPITTTNPRQSFFTSLTKFDCVKYDCPTHRGNSSGLCISVVNRVELLQLSGQRRYAIRSLQVIIGNFVEKMSHIFISFVHTDCVQRERMDKRFLCEERGRINSISKHR